MPRYFFHVIDGKDFIDEDGTELAGIDEARTQAIIMAGEILKEVGPTLWHGAKWHMDVLDEAGVTVVRLNFSAETADR